MKGKGRDKMWSLAMSRDTLTNSEENTAPYSSSKTPPATPPKSSLRTRLGNTREIREARELVKPLNLGEDIDMRKGRSERNAKLSKKKIGKEKADCVAKQGMTPNPKIRYKTSKSYKSGEEKCFSSEVIRNGYQPTRITKRISAQVNAQDGRECEAVRPEC